MRYCLGVDVAAIDSMYCLAAETGEVIFMPVKYPHTKDGFHRVLENFGEISHEDITVIMESTSTYHLKVERFFRENTACEIVILNPMISKNHKRNLRKTKIDKEMPLLLYYEKKRGEGKHHHACVVACCTKLLRILLAMSKQNSLYR